MIELVNGFLVVRKSNSMGVVEPYKKEFHVDGKSYEGIYRPHLYDLIEDYYQKKLPLDLQDIVRKSKDEANDHTFMQIIKDFNDAKKALDYAKDDNEIITFQSHKLNALKGKTIFDSNKIEWLGYDIISFGAGSLILNGIFFKPEYFIKWIEIINDHGLFPNTLKSDEYIEDYLAHAKKNLVEDHIFSEYGFETIRIGRVILTVN